MVEAYTHEEYVSIWTSSIVRVTRCNTHAMMPRTRRMKHVPTLSRPAMPEKSLLVRSESARRDDQQKKKTNDAGCSEQTFPKTCLKKFPRLQVKADVKKPIHEALSALEGYREGSRAQYSNRLRTLSRDSPDQINGGLHRGSGGAESRVYLSPDLQLQPASRVTRGA